MWNVVMLTVLMAVAGYYTLRVEENVAAIQPALANHLADSMAVYREAVVNYYVANPTQQGSVSIATLNAANVVPTWSTLFTDPASSPWANFRDTDGMIYVYAATLPAQNITDDIVRLSQNSVLAGVFRAGDTTLFSPVFGNTGIKLPQPSQVAIPNGSPIWIAIRS